LSARLHVLSGARAGVVLTITGEVTVLGRGPDTDLRFSPETDLEVSARHAALVRTHDGWILRDLESRNGTFLNGKRVHGDSVVRDGDRIGLGPTGPEIAFYITAAGAQPVATGPLPHAATVAAGHARGGWKTPRWTLLLTAIVFATAALASALVYGNRRERESWEQERAAMQARIDSLLVEGDRTVQSLEGQVDGLARALRESQEQVRRVSGELAQAERSKDTDQIALLRRQVQAATAALDRQQLAAGLDYRAIERQNRRAVAVVYVEDERGVVVTGTAFAVRPDGTLVSARHVFAGTSGAVRPRRIGVQFSDSEQVWPARILMASDGADIAILKIDNIEGDVPTVRALSARPDTLVAGTPVAVIGYPLGGDAPGRGERNARVVRPLVSAGVIHEVGGARLEIQGYGAAGASGSPIFDASGAVIAVLFGGRADNSGPIVLAVPISEATALLSRIR
jgi:pSer/pThr/pTyr-binding forkhead associated (FHA) protein